MTTDRTSTGGRLQRPPGPSGYRLDTFKDVFLRHGLTMGALAAACLLLPGSWALLSATMAPALQRPLPYLAAAAALLLFFNAWSRRRPAPAAQQTLWVGYLLFISIVEEVAFRLLFPALLSNFMPAVAAHVISNLCFAAIHYVTLRWRGINVAITFLGGMGLSHLMGRGDLALVILVHWLGTFLNTPRAPQRRGG